MTEEQGPRFCTRCGSVPLLEHAVADCDLCASLLVTGLCLMCNIEDILDSPVWPEGLMGSLPDGTVIPLRLARPSHHPVASSEKNN